MSTNLLEELGLDAESIEWTQLSLCRGMETELFYDEYESDPKIACQVDQACLVCPVMAQCGQQGLSGEYGVWGAIYWDGQGKPDKAKNAHKTEEDWKEIRRRLLS
jgi:hypothetical protein